MEKAAIDPTKGTTIWSYNPESYGGVHRGVAYWASGKDRRILMTTYHDLPSIVAGLHSGAIERLVQKPFTAAELMAAILPEGAPDAKHQRASA